MNIRTLHNYARWLQVKYHTFPVKKTITTEKWNKNNIDFSDINCIKVLAKQIYMTILEYISTFLELETFRSNLLVAYRLLPLRKNNT